MTSFVYIEHPPSINLVVSIRLAVYNFHSSKSNGSASPFRRENLATFKSSHLASSMARSFACFSSRQNPHNGKDEFAGGTPIQGSNCCTPVSAVTYTSIPAVAPVVAPLVVSGSANSSVVRYLKDDLQQILRTVLDSRPLALVLAPIIATAPHYQSPREQLLKTWFANIYWDKTHLECYNFFQKCKDHFATASATSSNQVLFAAILLKNTALFR